MKVLTKSLEDVDVEPIGEAGGLVLHQAICDPERFTVTHAKTGAAVFSKQRREVATAFFLRAAEWQEWQQGESLEDFQHLWARVMELRAEVLQTGEI